MQRLLRDQRVDPTRYKQMRLHRVADEGGLAQFGASSKLNTDPRLLTTLLGLGRAAADGWLTTCAQHVGHESTLDIGEVFLANRVRNARPAIKPPTKAVDKTVDKTVGKLIKPASPDPAMPSALRCQQAEQEQQGRRPTAKWQACTATRSSRSVAAGGGIVDFYGSEARPAGRCARSARAV